MLVNVEIQERTLIFYESPFRVVSAIEDIIEVLGDRRAVLAREITKMHEETIYGTLSSILEKLRDRKVKGEITLVVEGSK